MSIHKKILITEKQLKTLLESYGEFDYYDAFFLMFRKWIVETYGEDELKKPTSFLIKKYGSEFVKEYASGVFNRDDDDDWEINRWDIERIVKSAVERGKYTLPSLRSEKQFTEKYRKHLETLIENLDLPEYTKIKFSERRPYEVNGELSVDFEKWIKDPKQVHINATSVERKLIDYLTNYLGIEFGSPEHGNLEISISGPVNLGFEDWKKKVWGKVLRPEIKMEAGHDIKAIKLELDSRGINMKITYNWNTGYQKKREIREKIREILNSHGYGPNIRLYT